MSPFNPTPNPDNDGHYFTVAELRGRKKELANETNYPAEKVEAARAYAEQRFEGLANCAYVPRTVTETVIGTGRTHIFLESFIEVTAVSAVTVDGSALTPAELADIKVRRHGEIIRSSVWPLDSEIVVTYTHGFNSPPEPVKQAVLTLAAAHILPSNIPDRATVMTNEVGSFRVSIADKTGRTGIPEVDSVASPSQYGFEKPVVG